MEALVEANGLSKRFGKVRALEDLNLTLPTGEAVRSSVRTAPARPRSSDSSPPFSKQTAARSASAAAMYRRRDGGAPDDRSRRPVRRRRGDDDGPGEPLHGGPPLWAVGQDARSSAERILEQVGLDDAADRLVKTYSGGMRRRLDLGASLVGSPRLLLLDEPTTGLDPASRNEVWDDIRMMGNDGTDIILTTQYLDEADHLASSIVIIDEGRVIAQGTPSELKSRVGADVVELHTVDVSTMTRAAAVLAQSGSRPTDGGSGDEALLDRRSRRPEAPSHHRPRSRRGRSGG